ncbi:hypothetical protein VE01_06025 [Pseudogymnoascus verrucosus]|uniref:HNH nuclease domain-containing protein n=1 Tax=Pseudogymnoascus verrucosus TaxID=342668 RepID=A0A1B8GJE0_9PEZI|nr:uncharacterized protein VE01_06025 [Pseudogymnoascus verrucosus]OBT95951.2 hypothetical protein VE01_06025 [Pseudogymnoascus verrucosus]
MPGYRLSSRYERNIHFVNSENDELGGAWQAGSLTWAEMTQRMEILFELPTTNFALFPCLEDGDPNDPLSHHGPPIKLQKPNIIKPGFYVLLSPDGEPVDIPVNPEMPLPRALSRPLSSPNDPLSLKLRNRVRERDGRCVITGRKAKSGDFLALEVAHIFPVAQLEMVLYSH